MADAGIGEAALLAAAADAAAAGGTAAAAALPEVIGAGTALAGTAAAAAPEVVAAAAPELLGAAASAAPVVGDVAASSAPFIGATTSEPLLGSAVAADTGSTAAAAPSATSLLGNVADIDPSLVDLSLPQGATLPESAAPGSAPIGLPGSNLFDKFGAWWANASTGDKLKAGGTLLSGVSTAGKALTPTPAAGNQTTIKPGTTGKPTGGEQALASIVDAMLKRRDTYQQGQLGGVPVVYRPRGLLG
jgi:hypothetical protein